MVDSLSTYLERRSLPKRVLRQFRSARRVERTLRRYGPDLHRGFYEEGLNLIIRKD